MNFLETTMIGDVDLDDFFPDEQLDSTMVGKSQNQMSRITFDKSKEYANKKYAQNKEGIHSGKLNYMFLEISKEVRRRIQPIGNEAGVRAVEMWNCSWILCGWYL